MIISCTVIFYALLNLLHDRNSATAENTWHSVLS